MSIINKFSNPGDAQWYTDAFRNVLEDHLTYLRNSPETTVQIVEPIYLIKYRFDLFSLFRFYGLRDYMHWVTMRVNDLNSPTDDISQLLTYLVPSETILSQILQHYNSRNRTRGK